MSNVTEGLLSAATRSPPRIQEVLFLLPGRLHCCGISTVHVGLETGMRNLLREARIGICTFG